MIKFLRQKNKENKGFTLVETLIAISIFTVSVLTVLIFLSKGISNSTYAKRKLTATYLAQEGIEYMRSMRDTYMLYYSNGSPQTGWDAFYAKLISAGVSCNNATNGCIFNDANLFTGGAMPMVNKLTLTACTSTNCSSNPLFYNSSTGKYGYGSGTNSGFTRKINIVQVLNSAHPSVKEIQVFSTVYWAQGSATSSVKFAEDLFNWIE